MHISRTMCKLSNKWNVEVVKMSHTRTIEPELDYFVSMINFNFKYHNNRSLLVLSGRIQVTQEKYDRPWTAI